ncbi:MAG TPA: serine/threonine-protein kinase, partial [Vicinamibacteria bacterium]
MSTPEGQLLALAARVSDGASNETPADSTSDRDAAQAAGEGEEATLQALKEIARVADAYRALVRSDDAVPPSAEKAPLGRWGHFELIEKLGEGSAAEVFKAHDTRLDHDVALKLFKRTQLTDAEKQAVLEEGRRHARVKHANIVTIHDANEHDGRIGIAMEYIDGSTLHDVVTQRGPHSAEEAAHIGVELCLAVAAIHGKGLVHGDIKAQNVMREKGGRIVVMDFSASRPLSTTVASGGAPLEGTPIYMAPELFEGAGPSPQSDVYALGVLLFYLATGTYPLKARTLGELRAALRRGERQSLYDQRPDPKPPLGVVPPPRSRPRTGPHAPSRLRPP